MYAIKLAIICSLLSQTVALPNTFGTAISDSDAANLIKEGEAAAQASEWRSAAQSFVRAADSEKWKKTALFDLGVAYNHLGVYARALDCEQQVAQIDSKYVPAYIQMGTILTKMGNIDGAEVAFSKALALEPNSAEAKADLDNLRELAKGPSQAKNAIQAVKIFDGSETQSAAAAEKAAEPIEIVMPGEREKKVAEQQTVASADETSAKPAQTEAAPAAVEPAKPERKNDTAGSDESETSSALMSTADILKKQSSAKKIQLPSLLGDKEDPAKEAAMEEASRKAVKERKVLDLIMEATVYFNSGSVDSARTTLQSALKIEERCSLAHANLGVVLGTQGDYEGEVREEKRACELLQGNAEAHLNLAWALAKTKKYAEAEKEYSRAKELEAGLAEANAGAAYMLSKTGKKHEAVNMLVEARHQFGDKAWPCATLGAIYLDEKHYDDAAQSLKEALVREPNNTEALKRLAQLSAQTNKYQDAIDNYKLLLSKKPFDLDSYVAVALVQEKIGDKEGAVNSLRSASTIAPGNAEVQTSLRNLLHQTKHSNEGKEEAQLPAAK